MCPKYEIIHGKKVIGIFSTKDKGQGIFLGGGGGGGGRGWYMQALLYHILYDNSKSRFNPICKSLFWIALENIKSFWNYIRNKALCFFGGFGLQARVKSYFLWENTFYYISENT